jgi:hypothetical protein
LVYAADVCFYVVVSGFRFQVSAGAAALAAARRVDAAGCRETGTAGWLLPAGVGAAAMVRPLPSCQCHSAQCNHRVAQPETKNNAFYSLTDKKLFSTFYIIFFYFINLNVAIGVSCY